MNLVLVEAAKSIRNAVVSRLNDYRYSQSFKNCCFDCQLCRAKIAAEDIKHGSINKGVPKRHRRSIRGLIIPLICYEDSAPAGVFYAIVQAYRLDGRRVFAYWC